MRVSYCRKEVRSLGNYESIAFEISASEDVDYENGETQDSCYERLKFFADSKLHESMSDVLPSKKSTEEPRKSFQLDSGRASLESEIRSNIALLMGRDRNQYEFMIKDRLKTFGVNLLTELKDSQLVSFNKELLEML